MKVLDCLHQYRALDRVRLTVVNMLRAHEATIERLGSEPARCLCRVKHAREVNKRRLRQIDVLIACIEQAAGGLSVPGSRNIILPDWMDDEGRIIHRGESK